MATLRPYPFAALVHRQFGELERHGAIFDLPARKFFLGDPERSSAVRFHGLAASSPLGPAAGPQSQMAQNLVLSWLGGARIFELKTVQIRDELAIPRPCIDMRTVGLNAEWSQELKLEESLDEYVKGVMLIEMLRSSGRLDLAPGFGAALYDMSVGYDLDGIRSERVGTFIRGMLDARPAIERFRREIPAEHRRCRDLDYPACLSSTVTLSTFHGCPPDEIERIIDFLMREHGVHCVIKFNPMLLGKEEALHLLHDELGYTDFQVPDSAFARDTTWEQAVEIVERLGRTAAELGVGLGVKFTNTLIVENDAGFLPASEKEVYLSGPPLHVLAMHLVRRFRRRFGDRFPISFSAGIDRVNFPDAVALGLVPVTVCSDLLKPQGYGRLQSYGRELGRRMAAVGADSVDEFVLRAHGALAETSSISEAKGLNAERYVEGLAADPRYSRRENLRLPPKIGSRLVLFDCITCDKCIPVCPNDAIFTFRPPDAAIRVVKLRRETGGGWEWQEGKAMRLVERHQIGIFADFCNDCGNCDVFCPEDGGPYLAKPRFFGSEASWRAAAPIDGVFLERGPSGDRVLDRFAGEEYRLLVRDGWFTHSGAGFDIRYEGSDPAGTVSGRGPEEVDLTRGFILDELRRALLDSDELHVVSALAAVQGGGGTEEGGAGRAPGAGRRAPGGEWEA